MTDRKIEGRREDVEDARRTLQQRFSVALADVDRSAASLAIKAAIASMSDKDVRDELHSLAISDQRLSVGQAVLQAEMLDLRKIINESTLDKRIVDHIDNRVMERASKLIDDCVDRIEALIAYEVRIDDKLRALDLKIGEFESLRKVWNCG